MLNWASRFSIHIFLDSNSYRSPLGRYECMLAAGVAEQAIASTLPDVAALHSKHKSWLFGHITYDHKNTLFPKLTTSHTPDAELPTLHFFIPETICLISADQEELTITSVGDPEAIYQEIATQAPLPTPALPKLSFTKSFNKQDYITTVNKLREHIKEGDCYEINFCNKGYSDNATIDPLATYKALCQLSPAPFAAYYTLDNQYMMCASPERYLRKEGNRILSQPIKGTARRSANPTEDNNIKELLRNNLKERAENVMIVDLVRNDLAMACDVGSVQVDELFGIYSYPQVHQMISTVSGTLRTGLPFTDAIAHSFPMGSMTGAPKYKVMQLIDQYERSARSLFSGSVGYITPDGDFDLNVVIRSLFYNANTRMLHYQAGGAITYDSNAEQEWEEMSLKAWAMERIFS
jgi:para-aminobenzoate synthetase component 1